MTDKYAQNYLVIGSLREDTSLNDGLRRSTKPDNLLERIVEVANRQRSSAQTFIQTLYANHGCFDSWSLNHPLTFYALDLIYEQLDPSRVDLLDVLKIMECGKKFKNKLHHREAFCYRALSVYSGTRFEGVIRTKF